MVELASTLKQLDFFPKTNKEVLKRRQSGGALSVVATVIMVILFMSELSTYLSPPLEYDMGVDNDMDAKLEIDLDITIAMACSDFGADVVDASGAIVTESSAHLNKESVVFSESFPSSHKQDSFLKNMNNRSYKYKDTPNTSKVMKDGVNVVDYGGSTTPQHACRVSGKFNVNKVAGNLHFTTGHHPNGGGHTNNRDHSVNLASMNFTHRVDSLNFGPEYPGLHSPLDATFFRSVSHTSMSQYFVKLVPTTYYTSGGDIVKTYQYSVRDFHKSVDHAHGVHGMPGIFVGFVLSPVHVKITESSGSFLTFLVRISAIIGGVFTVTGMMDSFVSNTSNLLEQRKRGGRKYQPLI